MIAVLFANCTDGELRIDPTKIDNTMNESSGRLEICASNVWFSIYDSYEWSRPLSLTTALACRSLGFGEVGKIINALVCSQS